MKKLLLLFTFILTAGYGYSQESPATLTDTTQENSTAPTTEVTKYADAENYYLNTYLGSKYDIYTVDFKEDNEYIIVDPLMTENKYMGGEENIYIQYVRGNADNENTILVIETALEDLKANLAPNLYINYRFFGYEFDITKNPQIACSDGYFAGLNRELYQTEEYRTLISHGYEGIKNRALLKAIDYLKTSIDKGEYGAFGHYPLYIALAYYAQDGLYNLEDIVKYSKLYKENYREVEFDKNLSAGFFIPFILKMSESTITEPADFYKWAEESNILQYILFNNGYFDIYNDGIYHKVYINKVSEQSILFILDELLDYRNRDLYARYYYNIIGKDNNGDPYKYPARHCTDNVYYGNLYIMPFNKASYIINGTEVENKLNTIEIRNPAYFSTEYGKNYYASELFQDKTPKEKLHIVSQMESFGINGSVIYEKIYERDLMSAAGNVDTLKDQLNTLYALNFKQVMKNKKYTIEEFIAYLSQFTSIDLKKYGANCLFINISKTSTPVYLAVIEYDASNISYERKKYYFLLNKNLEILNKDVAKEINDFIYNTSYFKTILTNINNNPHVVLMDRNGEVLVINIDGEKVGFNKFPAYYYKSEREKTNALIERASLLGVAELDCSNAIEESVKMICSNRQLITYRAYIDILFNKKMKIAEINHYPANVIEYYNKMYDNIKTDYSKCGNTINCYLEVFRQYEEILLN